MKVDDIYFIKIEKPDEVRKTLLTGVRDVLHSLQSYDDFKKVRIAKAEQVIVLRKLVKEINVLLNRLKRDLPTVQKKKEKVKKVQKTVSKKSKKPAEKPPKHEVKALESQLKEIETKLRGL